MPRRSAGRGKSSGVEVETRAAHVWTIPNGNAIPIQMFGTPAEALEAAGLRE
jgi:hypothetical protein